VVTDLLTHVYAKQCWKQQIRVRFVSPGVSLRLVLVFSACLAANTADAANCGEASGSAAVSACDQELARDPDSIEVRLRYADVLMGQQQYQQAVIILRDALAMQPGNNTVKQKYRLASSLAEEQQSIDRLSTDTPAVGTRNSVQEILCKTLKGQRAISACDQVLATDPLNITALTRRGDELMALDQVGEAVVSYRRAVALEPANQTLMNKLSRAESKMPAKPRVVVVEAPLKDEAVKAAEKKRKAEEVRLAEEKRKANEVKRKEEAERKLKEAEQHRLAELEQKRMEEAERKLKEAEQRRLAELEQKRKEAELMAKLETSPPEVVAKYSNAPFANGSTY
jgi:tetratricopeptide (TPR) repeat protein